MGVINVTPDSFSDGGAYSRPEAALVQARRLVAHGAQILDLGAESTRPGATPVAAAEEWHRLEPVLKQLQAANLGVPLSVDTRKDEIMLRSAGLGVQWINDASGRAAPATLAKLASYPQMGYIAMHMPFSPDIMQTTPLQAQAALTAVAAFFAERQRSALAAGFKPAQVWLDPGIGFGKTDAANIQLLAATSRWAASYQIAIGISRKSLLGRSLGIANPEERDAPSKTLELGLAMLGAKLIRTHSVQPLRRLLDLLNGGPDA